MHASSRATALGRTLIAAVSDETATVFMPGMDWNMSISPIATAGATTTWAACRDGDDYCNQPYYDCRLPNSYLEVTLRATTLYYSRILTTIWGDPAEGTESYIVVLFCGKQRSKIHGCPAHTPGTVRAHTGPASPRPRAPQPARRT